jgi:hypothetical protein
LSESAEISDTSAQASGFAHLLDRIEGNGARVLTAGGDDLTGSSDPRRKMMRHIAGACRQASGA